MNIYRIIKNTYKVIDALHTLAQNSTIAMTVMKSSVLDNEREKSKLSGQEHKLPVPQIQLYERELRVLTLILRHPASPTT